MIANVAKSFEKKMLDDIYAIWSTLSGNELGGDVYYVNIGSYDEDDMLELIAHVEAAAGGKTAKIFGTKKALRVLAPSIQGADSKSDLYHMGYYGMFYGNPTFVIPQRHQINSTSFVMPDDIITVIAGDDKFIKFVYEGDPLIIEHEAADNADLTVEYFYAVKYGLGVVLAGDKNTGIGRYEM